MKQMPICKILMVEIGLPKVRLPVKKLRCNITQQIISFGGC